MKALLVSRPGDFGVLEEYWTHDPVFLPLPGGTVLDLHEASLAAMGVTEARLLRCHPLDKRPDLEPLESVLQGRLLKWSVRGWPLGPWPQGWTLSQALAQQAVFLNRDEVLIFFVPAADPRGWTGPQVPFGFPQAEIPTVKPQRWDTTGRLTPWEGPLVSLAGSRDFYRTSMRFLEILPPHPLGLKGIHRNATLEPPLSLGREIKAAARARVGPLVQLADGSRLDAGSSLSRTLVLTPTHFSRDFSVADKIVIGDTVVEPVRGGVVPLPRGA